MGIKICRTALCCNIEEEKENTNNQFDIKLYPENKINIKKKKKLWF